MLDDDYASNRHAQLFPHEGVWVVEDLGSTNGTLLNGQPVRAPQTLRSGDAIDIGTVRLKVNRS